MKVFVNMITRDRLVCRYVPIEVAEVAVRNGALPKTLSRAISEGKYWCAELEIGNGDEFKAKAWRRYELVERGDEIWYAEVETE